MQIVSELIEKYNIPVPRYTSYPTVPFWDMEKTNCITVDGYCEIHF